MENRVVVSVIIPVYNSSKYIKECVDTVLRQSLSDFEIILVDDGSKDDSPKICDELAKRSNIISIHQINGGAAKARNVGLEHAKGEYVVFVDSDDFLPDNDSFSKLRDIMDQHPEFDFVGFNMLYFWNQSRTKKYCHYNDDCISPELTKRQRMIGLAKSGSFPVSPATKFIRKSFLDSNQIRFTEGTVGEDILWFMQLLVWSKNFLWINDTYYCYRKSVSTSVTGTINYKKFNDFFVILNEIIDFSKNSDSIYQDSLYSFCAYQWTILLGEIGNLKLDEQKLFRTKLNSFVWLFKYDLSPKVRKVKALYNIIGLNLTSKLLHYYIIKKVRNNK